MRRQNLLWGGTVLAFGLGVLVGTWLKSGFVCHLVGIGLIFLGLSLMRKH